MQRTALRASCRPRARCVPSSPLRSRLEISARGGRSQTRSRSDRTSSEDEQAIPLTGYYAELLQQPPHKAAPLVRVATVNTPADWLPRTVKEETLAKAQAVFGSRLASAADHADAKASASTTIAGVVVPPKPAEPDNCCMSGCVNCVWDLYRDDMEEWAAKSAEARVKLQARRAAGRASGSMLQSTGTPTHVAVSMDDDGGGSESNWSAAGDDAGGPEDLFGSIPVGIREFMKTEKMLKQRQQGAG